MNLLIIYNHSSSNDFYSDNDDDKLIIQVVVVLVICSRMKCREFVKVLRAISGQRFVNQFLEAV